MQILTMFFYLILYNSEILCNFAPVNTRIIAYGAIMNY